MSDFFAGQGLVINDVIHLSPQETLAATDRGALLVDLREKYLVAMKAFGVRAVIYLPFSDFESSFRRLPTDRPLVLADAVGLYSKEAAAFLRQHGYAEVAQLNGGIVAWEDAGLPIHVDRKELWSGSCMCQLRPRGKS